MEEDEDVDIVGEDVLTAKNELAISCISAGQLLSFDYTVHPRWLSDSNDAVELWPDNLPKQSSQDKMEMVQDEVVIEEPAAIAYDWCEELSNYGDLILEQDIPATLEEEVVANIGVQNTIELYKKPSVVNHVKQKSLLKSNNYLTSKKNSGLSNKLANIFIVNKNGSACRKNSYISTSSIEKKSPTTKRSMNIKVLSRDVKNFKVKKKNSIESDRNDSVQTSTKSLNRLNSLKSIKPKPANRRFIDLHGENITINHEMDLEQNLSYNAGHITEEIKLPSQNESKESDPEIDIESDCGTNNEYQSTSIQSVVHQPIIKEETKEDHSVKPKQELPEQFACDNYPPEIDVIMKNSKCPNEEIKLNPDIVTDLEKYFHAEFFEGRPTKTPERYMKIRRYILNAWNDGKPMYIGKTSVRNGLKNCGDVNCISRIHQLLEQIGAINFGHSPNHFEYVRPLSNLYQTFVQTTPANKLLTDDIGVQKILPRQRMLKKNGTNRKWKDVNYTLSHNENIPIVLQSTVSNKTIDESFPDSIEQKYVKPEFQLVKCLRFDAQQKAPFKISIKLSSLLCLQLHSLSASHEVMGFLGGHREKIHGCNRLQLTRYKPCRTSHQNSTMCEMCPVSQVEQSSSLLAENKDLLGWFHSHPTFPPDPSRMDIRTQEEMQHQFSFDIEKPFVGFILGCVDMSYKCIYILPQDLHNIEAECVPYEMNVDVVNDLDNFYNEIQDVLNLIDEQVFSEIIQRFICSSNTLLEEYGHDVNILNYLKSTLAVK